MTTVAGAGVAAQPVERLVLRRRGGDDEERVAAQPRDRRVELDPAARVEHRRVDDAARRPVQVGGEDPLDQRQRLRAVHAQLGERGEIEERDALARGAVLRGHRAEPVLAAVGVGVLRALARRRVPVRPLPAGGLAEAGAGGGEPVVQRDAPQPARRARLQEGPVHRVQAAQRLARACVQVARVALGRREAADVERRRRPPSGRRSSIHSASARPAPGPRMMPWRVQAGRDEEPGDLGGLAQQEVAVGREALGRAQVVREARLPQRRHAHARLGERPCEVLEVGLELAKGEVRRDGGGGTRPPVGLEGADEEAAAVVPHVDGAVQVADDRQVARGPVHRLRLRPVVLGRVQRQPGAGEQAEVA